MIFIQHRVNTLEDLNNVPAEYGAEVDIRYHNDDLILHHDPFSHHHSPTPLKLEDFLKNYGLKGPLILNVKTEGVEEKCIDLMKNYQVKNWFFLDLSMPYFVKYSLMSMSSERKDFVPDNLAVRFSEFEPIEYALSFKESSNWVWVDCFSKFPIDYENYVKLKDSFKICLVSPELQGHSLETINDFKDKIKEMGINIEAVCTKRPDLWM